MIGNIQFSAYQQIARMSSNLDNMIQEALVAKSQISSQIQNPNFASFTGIGNNIDMKA
jgi:hypothetical protein